jgi:hypothetical protein
LNGCLQERGEGSSFLAGADQPELLYQFEREKVYITAIGCEIEFGGARELQANGAGGLSPSAE